MTTYLQTYNNVIIFFYLAQQPPEGQVNLIHEVSKVNTTTHHIR
jgi:hypothetical protein